MRDSLALMQCFVQKKVHLHKHAALYIISLVVNERQLLMCEISLMEGPMIDIRPLHTIPELEEAVDVQAAVWGLNLRNAVPSAITHVLTMRGGLVLGAYDADRMIGMLLALPAQDHGEWILWSHMTGIMPQYQGRGIGASLKRFQREWALSQGYHRIGWTVDPLQRGNAHFNFHLLGQDAALTARTYHVNFYGDMDDDINRGLPSDRIEAMWCIDQPSLHAPLDPETPMILSVNDALQPVSSVDDFGWDASLIQIALPRNLEAIRRMGVDGVLSWRLAVREKLQAAFARGYAIVDFSSADGSDKYILKRIGDSV
jgi:chorismate synthase